MPTLMQRLKDLGVSQGAQEIYAPMNRSKSIGEVFQGRFISKKDHEVFIRHIQYSLPYEIGATSLNSDIDTRPISRWTGHQSHEMVKIAFIDTETSGLARGTGTFVFLFGLCFLTAETLEVKQIFLTDPYSEKLFLETIEKELATFEAICSYNGKSFDIPITRSRNIINHVPDFTQKIDHYDLLHLARRIWRLRLEDRSLKHIENNILGFHRSEDEIPGYLVPEFYVKFLRSNDAELLKGIFYHNLMDVISLAAIFSYLGKFTIDPFNEKAPNVLDVYALAQLHEKRGNYDYAFELYTKILKLNNTSDNLKNILLHLGLISKKKKDYSEARMYFEKSAALGSIAGCIEASKLYEHIFHDEIQALSLLNQIENNYRESSKYGSPNENDHDMIKRVERLRRKIDKRQQKA